MKLSVMPQHWNLLKSNLQHGRMWYDTQVLQLFNSTTTCPPVSENHRNKGPVHSANHPNKHPAVQFFSDSYHRGLSLRRFASPGWLCSPRICGSRPGSATSIYQLPWTCGCGAWSDLAAFCDCLCMGTLAMGPPSEIFSQAITYHQINWFPLYSLG